MPYVRICFRECLYILTAAMFATYDDSHTAYYDEAGDLVGIRPQHLRTNPFFQVLSFGTGADVQKLYLNYARGWMIIDVVSVMPWAWLESVFRDTESNPDSGKEAKALKVLRLLRLTKLLRLARAMRIFKKYEDALVCMRRLQSSFLTKC
jgi:hypothetical protein